MSAGWPLFTGWLLHSMAGGGVLLLLALPLMAACRQPARRQRLGELALLAALFLPLVNLGPAWITLPLPHAEPAPLAASELLSRQLLTPTPPPDAAFDSTDGTEPTGPREPDGEGFAVLERGPDQPEFSMPEASDSAPSDVGPNLARGMAPFNFARWAPLLGFAYVAAGTCLLGRWLVGHFVLWRLLRAAHPPPHAIHQLFEGMARGQSRRPRLLVSRRLRVPLSCGLLRPCVVVPALLLGPKTARTLRWVFAHELTHLERGDAWTCLLFGLGQIVYFHLPWFWWLRRHVRLCQEYVADAAAAEQTNAPEDYAQFLIGLTQAPAVPLGTLGVLGDSSDLFRRVTMLLQNPLPVEKSCPRWWSVAAASSLLGLAFLVSGIRVRADAASPPTEKQTLSRVQEQSQTANSDEVRSPLEPPVAQGADDTLRDRPRVERRSPLSGGRLGVSVQKPSPDLADQLDLPTGQGLVIESVLPDSAAAKAGLKKHDILFEFNGKPVPNKVADFVKMVNEVKANTPLDVVVLRKGKKETIKGLSLAEAKSIQPYPFQAAPGAQPFQFRVNPGVQPFPVPPGGRTPFNWTPPNVQFHSFGPPGERGVFATIFRTKDSFNTRYQEGSLIITVMGSVTDGKGKVKEIHIQDGGQSAAYVSADEVPEQYRDKVKYLIEMSEKNILKIEVSDQKKESFNRNREQRNSGQTNTHQVIINLENGNAAKLAEALKVLIHEMQSNRELGVRAGREAERNLFPTGGVPPDVVRVNSRNFEIPIHVAEGQRSRIKELILFASPDQGQTWKEVAVASPDQDAFIFCAPADGLYWFNICVVDAQGRRDPPDIYKTAPRQKILVDTLEPNVHGNRALSDSAHSPIFLSAIGTKLVASSDDPDALNLVSELYRQLQNPPGEGDYEIIRLKYAGAADAARRLVQTFRASDFRRGEKVIEPRIRVVADSASNSVLVHANPLEMILVRALVKKIDKE